MKLGELTIFDLNSSYIAHIQVGVAMNSKKLPINHYSAFNLLSNYFVSNKILSYLVN